MSDLHRPPADAYAHPRPIHVKPHEHPRPHPIAPLAEATAGVFAALLPELRRAVAEEGYATPTPIQEQAIPHLLAGRDLIGCAQTGTGKTAAFVLPILQYLGGHPRPASSNRPRVLILAPTRELAAQIGESIRAYGRHLRRSHVVIFGGVGQHPQVVALQRGVDFVVATPGRLLDLMQQGHARLDGVEIFVLDEADRMFDMGFLPDVRRIIAKLPTRRHSLFFSATMAPEIVALARTLVHDPVHIAIAPEQPTVERIAQKVMFVEQEDKDALLAEILRDPKIDRVLVFTQMKHAADKVMRKLVAVGIPAAVIHGNKSQNARTEALAKFKSGRIRVLVATDIAARGIDVDGITHVVNFDLPHEPETYVHRIGRTARAGADGDAVSFCAPREREDLRAIERLIRKEVPADLAQPYHSELAKTATGAAARPLPKAQRGGGRSPRGGARTAPSRHVPSSSHGGNRFRRG